MSNTSFENLDVYKLAERLADLIWQLVSRWEYFEKTTVGKQLVRSADSISANIAEGCGRFNYNDNAKFIKISRGSLYETKNWLRRAYQRGLLSESDVKELRPVMDELLPRLNAYLSSVKKMGDKAINN